jgi:hypothetical protein
MKKTERTMKKLLKVIIEAAVVVSIIALVGSCLKGDIEKIVMFSLLLCMNCVFVYRCNN